jgi:D-sedoheptulose 7-phosphate isomerase
MADCLAAGGKLMFCGNGGSAADSQHLAAELTGRYIADRRPLAALALSTDTSALTSIANDYAFADVFERQVAALGRPPDCLIGISTSGNSANLLHAFATARRTGLTTIGLLGRDGGRLAALCDIGIVVPSFTTARIQETHIFIGHSLCGLIEHRLGLVGAIAESGASQAVASGQPPANGKLRAAASAAAALTSALR